MNGEIHRTAVPPGACLPGNLVNVRTSAVQYTAPSAAAAPVFPKNYLTYPTGANLIFTTANDDDTDAGGLQLFTPRDPVTGSIDVYFAVRRPSRGCGCGWAGLGAPVPRPHARRTRGGAPRSSTSACATRWTTRATAPCTEWPTAPTGATTSAT